MGDDVGLLWGELDSRPIEAWLQSLSVGELFGVNKRARCTHRFVDALQDDADLLLREDSWLQRSRDVQYHDETILTRSSAREANSKAQPPCKRWSTESSNVCSSAPYLSRDLATLVRRAAWLWALALSDLSFCVGMASVANAKKDYKPSHQRRERHWCASQGPTSKM